MYQYRRISKRFVLWCVDQSDLGEVSVGCHLDIYFPIELVLLDPWLLKWIIVHIPVLLFIYVLLDFFLNQTFSVCLSLVRKYSLEIYSNTGKCPFMCALILLNFRVHEISCKEKDKLWLELLFSNLFDENAKLVNWYSQVFLSLGVDWSLEASVFELNLACNCVEENILDSLSGLCSLLIVLQWVIWDTERLLDIPVVLLVIPSVAFQLLFELLHFIQRSFNNFNVFQQ